LDAAFGKKSNPNHTKKVVNQTKPRKTTHLDVVLHQQPGRPAQGHLKRQRRAASRRHPGAHVAAEPAKARCNRAAEASQSNAPETGAWKMETRERAYVDFKPGLFRTNLGTWRADTLGRGMSVWIKAPKQFPNHSGREQER